jgi:hypothetical protein
MPRLRLLAAALLFPTLVTAATAADFTARGSVPALAADGDLVALVTADKTALSCATSRDGGNTFSAPTPIGTVDPGQMLGMRRGPQAAVRGNTILVVTNNAKGNRILAFRSEDAGKSWKGPTPIDTPAGHSLEGLLSIAPTRDGFAVVFLELPEPKSMRIALARSTDDGKTFLPARPVYTSPDGHVCECCQPTVASDRQGRLAVMFRNFLAGNRDMYLLTSADDGKTFTDAQKLGNASWKLNACPMDGGGLTFAPDPLTHEPAPLVVFRRETTLFTARPSDQETRLAPGKSPVIANTPDGLVLAWETPAGITVRTPGTPDLSIDKAAAPVLTPTARGVLLAYTTQSANTDTTHTRLVWERKSQ